MKKLFVLSVLMCTMAFASAQMLIKENGKVCIGRTDRPNDDSWNVLKAIVYGDHGIYNAGAKLAFGDFGQRDTVAVEDQLRDRRIQDNIPVVGEAEELIVP